MQETHDVQASSAQSAAGEIDRAELIEDAGALGAIEPGWRRLAEARGNAFITPEWFRAWLSHYGDGATVAVAAAWRGDELAGLLPLVRMTDGRPRTIRFGGANLGDHFQLVAPEAEVNQVAAALAPVLPLGGGGPGAMVLDNVDADAPWCSVLTERLGKAVRVYETKRATLHNRRLAGLGWDDFMASQSSNFRRDVRKKHNRLERDHRLEFRRTAGEHELTGDLETLFRLHDLRWDERGGSSSAGERPRAVISEFASLALERGWLELWFLALDGTEVAASLCWRLGDRYCSYQTGFDPSLRKESVGFVLAAHTLRAAIEAGADEYDMLIGDEAWKERFADSTRPVRTLAIALASHPARAAISAEVGARRLLARMPEGGRLRSLAGAGGRLLPTARRR